MDTSDINGKSNPGEVSVHIILTLMENLPIITPAIALLNRLINCLQLKIWSEVNCSYSDSHLICISRPDSY